MGLTRMNYLNLPPMPLSGIGIHNAPIVFAESYHSLQSLSFLKWSLPKRNPNFFHGSNLFQKVFQTILYCELNPVFLTKHKTRVK